MLVEPRHDLDEIAGPRAVIELRAQNAVPAVAAGAGRTGQAEDEGRPRHAGGDAALDGRGADLGVAQHVKGDRKAVHALLEQRLDRLRRDVAAGKAGAAGGDDRIHARISDPAPDDAADRVDIVGDDLACRQVMAGGGDPLRKRRAGLVVGQRAGVGDRQHRDVERDELFCFVDGHYIPPLRQDLPRYPEVRALTRLEVGSTGSPSFEARRRVAHLRMTPQAANYNYTPPPNVLQACTEPSL